MSAAAAAATVAAARRWIGTPYQQGGRARGRGCDCLGLIVGLWAELRADPPPLVPPYGADWPLSRPPEPLWAALAAYLPASAGHELAAGQVILLRMRAGAVAGHLGLVTSGAPHPAFVHAYARHGVVESPLPDPWQRRIVAKFDLIETKE